MIIVFKNEIESIIINTVKGIYNKIRKVLYRKRKIHKILKNKVYVGRILSYNKEKMLDKLEN